MQVDDIGVFIGIDVGKSEHWATALDRDGRRIHDRALPNDESRLRDLYKHLAEHGRVLVVVINPRPSGPWLSRWPRIWVSQWATCRDCRCAASQT